MTTPTTAPIDHAWLAARVAEIVEDDAIDPSEDLTLYGLDSMGVMRLAMLLEERGIVVPFDELIAAPRLDAWMRLIAARA